MSFTRVGALIAMPMAVLSAMRARLTAFCDRMRSTRALATSTSARVTSNLGRVPTSKKPRALRRFSAARSTAWALTTTRRAAKSWLKYASFTASAIRSFCSSTSWREDSAPALAASVAAHVLPKSQRSWEAVMLAVGETDWGGTGTGRRGLAGQVVAEPREDLRLVLQRDGHGLVQRQLALGDLGRGHKGAEPGG